MTASLRRFIAVQRSATSLFAYVEVAEGSSAESALIADASQWTNADEAPNFLDRSRYASETTDDLAVYEVPADLVLDEEIDAHSVSGDRVLADYEEFDFVGYLVREARPDANEDEAIAELDNGRFALVGCHKFSIEQDETFAAVRADVYVQIGREQTVVELYEYLEIDRADDVSLCNDNTSAFDAGGGRAVWEDELRSLLRSAGIDEDGEDDALTTIRAAAIEVLDREIDGDDEAIDAARSAREAAKAA